MPRENSFSDSEGRSLTPDMEDEFRRDSGDYVPPIGSPASFGGPIPPVLHVTEPSPRLAHGLNPLSPSKRSIRSKTTIKSPATIKSAVAHPWAHLTPKDKFRAAVRRIMAMRRGTSFLTSTGGRIGAEPGVNPRRASAEIQYGHIKQDCVIEVVDYSAVRSSTGRMTNQEFINLLDDPAACERDPWVKVRWINIGGMSWDVIKAVSLKHELHPLALEDVFHTRSQNRSKADYYSKHLFLRILCHELGSEDESVEPTQSAAYGSTLTGVPRSHSPEPISEEEDIDTKEHVEDDVTVANVSNQSTMKKRRRMPLLPNSQRDLEAMLGPDGGDGNRSHSSLARLMGYGKKAENNRQRQAEDEVTLDALKRGERVNVKVSPMFVFLLRDGTVISIHPTPNLNFTNPISQRLRQRDTGLRQSADPSLLVHALLDLIVDNALEVIDAYHAKINKFERSILLKPKIKTVRSLHILSGDLILHKRTLEPIKTMIYGLRRYDLDRAAALVDMSDPANANKKIVGFMSHKTKIYLADVFDHMEYILTSLDMFAGISENLIGYTFNLASYEMNEVMRRLTLATIIFLPLTLLTGYFGMNFDPMWSVNKNSDLLFWEIAIPVMAIVIPAFCLPDIYRLIHYMQKKMSTKKAVKTLKQA
ncbi:Cobalt/magnesium transport protein CorA [Hypsizygus marmoreus]|uniref:Cobalt/magnesium transport protein CorA n=1 Tax=Hypsizygus marmoreus TaxID=39966 RepID=A0A369K9U9_HYPMA|nr:Cobalt/magnesium transport protein CorA [Hypsizygus marmoreus]